MNPDNQQPECTDEQLDALLKDIAIPVDLKNALTEIADAQDELVLSDRSSKPRISMSKFVAMALAASLIGVVAFGSWHWHRRTQQTPIVVAVESSGKTQGAHEKGLSSATTDSVAIAEANRLLDEILKIEKQVAMVLGENEYADVERQVRLAELEQSQRLSQFETQSMIFALGAQAIIPLGGSTELVESDMTSVIQMFPGTRGAELAKQFLEIQN